MIISIPTHQNTNTHQLVFSWPHSISFLRRSRCQRSEAGWDNHSLSLSMFIKDCCIVYCSSPLSITLYSIPHTKDVEVWHSSHYSLSHPQPTSCEVVSSFVAVAPSSSLLSEVCQLDDCWHSDERILDVVISHAANMVGWGPHPLSCTTHQRIWTAEQQQTTVAIDFCPQLPCCRRPSCQTRKYWVTRRMLIGCVSPKGKY